MTLEDPFYVVKDEVFKALNKTRGLYLRWQEISQALVPPHSPEAEWTSTELKNALRSIEWDLEDLEDTISIVEKNSNKFKIDNKEITERKKFIDNTRKEVKIMRDMVAKSGASRSLIRQPIDGTEDDWGSPRTPLLELTTSSGNDWSSSRDRSWETGPSTPFDRSWDTESSTPRDRALEPMVSTPRDRALEPIVSTPRGRAVEPMITPRDRALEPMISTPRNRAMEPLVATPRDRILDSECSTPLIVRFGEASVPSAPRKPPPSSIIRKEHADSDQDLMDELEVSSSNLKWISRSLNDELNEHLILVEDLSSEIDYNSSNLDSANLMASRVLRYSNDRRQWFSIGILFLMLVLVLLLFAIL